MTLDRLLKLARKTLRDRSKPYLWDDEDIVTYLNEAQEKVVRKTLAFVRDDEELQLSAGTALYDLPDYVQLVYRVRLDGITGELAASTDNWTPVDNLLAQPSRYTLDTATQSIRFWSTPDKDYTAIMRIARFPTELAVDNLDAECELPGKYQLALVDWAAYRCFTHDDADGNNADAAQRAKDRYEEAVRDHKEDLYRFRTGGATRASGHRIV